MDALEKGVAHFNAGRYREALACFRALRGPEARCFAAHALAGLGRLEQAARSLAETARLHPEHEPAYAALAALARANPGRAGVARALDAAAARARAVPAALRAALVRAQAQSALGRGRDAEALRRWRELAALLPGDDEAARHLELAARKKAAPVESKPAARRLAARPKPARRRPARAPEKTLAFSDLRALLDRPGGLVAGKTFEGGLRALEAAARAGGSPLAAATAALAAGDYRRLDALLPAAAREAANTPNARVVAALQESLGRRGEAAELLARLAGRGVPWACEAARVAENAGLYVRAAALWESAARRGGFEAAARRARLALWAGDAASCRRWAGRLGRGARARRRLEALAAALEDQGARALSGLDRELRLAPDDLELRCWKAETLRRAGRAAEARREAERVLAKEPFALPAMVNRILCLLDEGRAPRRQDRLGLQLLGLPAPDAAPAEADRAACEGVLARLGGNRSIETTVLGRGGVERLVVPNPRAPMQALQRGVAFRPAEAVLAEFGRKAAGARDRLERARWLVHRGEVKLWLGDLDGARADIERGLGFPDLKWPPVGAAGCAMLQGRLSEAEKLIARGAAGGASERVWLSWRGELRRRQGRLREAVADLQRSAGPAAGPYVALNLALALLARREKIRARALLAEVASGSWALVAAAACRAGRGGDRRVAELPETALAPTLEAALALLRGNRSHALVTWMPADGDVRVAKLFT